MAKIEIKKVEIGIQGINYMIQEEESPGLGHGGGTRLGCNDSGEKGVSGTNAVGIHQVPALHASSIYTIYKINY